MDGMRSAWLKWARAIEHAKEFAADIRRYESADNYNYERTDNCRDYADPLLKAHWRLRLKEPYPERWSVLIGDVVTNLRGALDHAFWYAVHHQSGVPSKPEAINFPICRLESKFGKQEKALKALVQPEIWKAVEVLQPYHAGDQANLHPLEMLRWLSNVDKHREMHIVSHISINLAPIMVQADPPVEVVEDWRLDGPAKAGSVLARLKIKRPSGGQEIELVPTFAHIPSLQISDDPQPDHHPLGSVMQVIANQVMDVLAAFNTLLSLEVPESLELGERYDAEHADFSGAIMRFTDADGNTTLRHIDT